MSQFYGKEADIERFWSYVDKQDESSCWLWQAGIHKWGYGVFGGFKIANTILAHRLAYILEIGPIPEGYTLHHMCGVQACCNPNHLKLLTASEHSRLHAKS